MVLLAAGCDLLLAALILYGLVFPWRISQHLIGLATDPVAREERIWVFDDPFKELAGHAFLVGLMALFIALLGVVLLAKAYFLVKGRARPFVRFVSWASLFAVPPGTLSGISSLLLTRNSLAPEHRGKEGHL